MLHKTFRRGLCALLTLGMLSVAPISHSAEKDSFKIAWSIYAGWVPWEWIQSSGLMKKWADKYDIEVEIVQINDYIESINQYTAGQFDGVTLTSMDALSIPSAGGVDTTVLIVGDYSNGNDGIVSKSASSVEQLKGSTIHLVELSVSHYLLARALDEVGLRERDVRLVNTSDADIVSAFQTRDVQTVVTWNPLLNEVAAMPGSHRLTDSSSIPGHIKDLTAVNTATLAANPAFGKALTGAWYEMMAILESDSAEGRELREYLGDIAGTDREGYEAQLAGMMMFWEPSEAIDFVNSDKAFEAMDSVRQFSFQHGLLGEGARSPDFVGISFPGGKVLGDAGNIKLRFDNTFMQMAADGEL